MSNYPRREEYQELQDILVRLAELAKTYMDKAASALKEMDGMVQDLDARWRQRYEELRTEHERALEQRMEGLSHVPLSQQNQAADPQR